MMSLRTLAVLLLATPAAAGTKPNILFIVCDDLNTHVAFAGYSPIRTPNLDAFAADGMVFTRAYCQYPVCGPSRASFLSGLYPESTGVLNNKIDIRKLRPNTPTLPGHLRRHGYWTARTGKIFHSPRHNPEAAWDASPPLNRNDELPTARRARAAFLKTHESTRGKNRKAYLKFVQNYATQTRGQKRPGYGPTGLTDDQHADGKNARQVIRWLRDKPYGDKPFFIALGIQKPHVPFLAPKKYFDMYPRAGLKFKLSPPDDWGDIPEIAQNRRYTAFGFRPGRENDPLRREYIQAYHACVTFVDVQIGRVIQTLKDRGLYNDTVIVFTSDHGYHLGEHFMWGKVTLFEECARVPLAVRVPGLTGAGTRSASLVELVDLFQTLAELAGLPVPPGLQGHSLIPVLKNPEATTREVSYTVVSRRGGLGRSIRTARYRYAEWGGPEDAELYDLRADPHEYTNLAGKPAVADIKKKLTAELSAARRRASSRRK